MPLLIKWRRVSFDVLPHSISSAFDRLDKLIILNRGEMSSQYIIIDDKIDDTRRKIFANNSFIYVDIFPDKSLTQKDRL